MFIKGETWQFTPTQNSFLSSRGWRFIPVAFHHISGHYSTSPSFILIISSLENYLRATEASPSCSYCISSQHWVAAQPGTAGPHEINNTTTQDLHCVLSGTIFLSLARIDNWAPFVLLSAVRSRWSPRASDLVIWQCLVKPGAGLSSPAKEFHSALMLLMGLFIVAPPGLSRHVHSIRAFKTSFVTEWNVTECAAYHRTIICPASLFTHFRSCQSLHRLMNNRVRRRVPSEQ